MSTNKDDYNHLGLTDSEVLQSREKNGINLLTPPKRPSLWKLYLEKFEDPVVRVLLVAAVFSLIISIIENEYAETIGIIAAILLATGIGFFFEYDANKKFDLANLIGKIGFTVAGLAFLIFFVKDVLLYFDFGALNGWHEWLPVFERTLKYFMMAVTLIVVAVPEGLPMSVTLSLALNMRRMLSTNNLVRKMHACETMGAITVICTDKTGTLTQNLMQVHEPNFYGIKNGSNLSDDDISALIAEGISANSTAFLEETETGEKPKGVGNPTEVAIMAQ